MDERSGRGSGNGGRSTKGIESRIRFPKRWPARRRRCTLKTSPARSATRYAAAGIRGVVTATYRRILDAVACRCSPRHTSRAYGGMRALLRNGKLPRPRLDVEEYVHPRTVTVNGQGTDHARSRHSVSVAPQRERERERIDTRDRNAIRK